MALRFSASSSTREEPQKVQRVAMTTSGKETLAPHSRQRQVRVLGPAPRPFGACRSPSASACATISSAGPSTALSGASHVDLAPDHVHPLRAPGVPFGTQALELLVQHLQRLVREVFEVDQPVVGALDGADELVELEVDRPRIAVLRVLDQEDHEE